MGNWRQLIQRACIMHQNIQPAEALHDRRPDHVDIFLGFLQIERQQGSWLPAGSADRVIYFFQPALGARHQYALRAKLGQFQRQCRTNPA